MGDPMTESNRSKKSLPEMNGSLPAASPRRGDRNESQTVLRACEVLKSFRSLGEELSLTEVIERTRLPKTMSVPVAANADSWRVAGARQFRRVPQLLWSGNGKAFADRLCGAGRL